MNIKITYKEDISFTPKINLKEKTNEKINITDDISDDISHPIGFISPIMDKKTIRKRDKEQELDH